MIALPQGFEVILNNTVRPCFKKNGEGARGVAQVVQRLPSKHEAHTHTHTHTQLLFKNKSSERESASRIFFEISFLFICLS
jgi:hypothetical protein